MKTAVYSLIMFAWLVLFAGFKGSHPLFACSLAIAALLFLSNFLKTREILFDKLNYKKIFLFFFPVISISWLIVIFVQYYSFEYSGFDTGIYANQIANFLKENRLFCTIYNKHPFANHFTPNLFLLSPLFLIKDSFLWLPIIKLLSFLACPFILFLISRAVLGSNSKYLWLIPLLWVFNRYLANTLRFEFQVSSLSLPFILLAFYFAIINKKLPLILSLVFLLGFKEHLALVWVSVGIFLIFFMDQKKHGISITALGILAGLLIYFVIMPLFGEAGELSHNYRFGPQHLIIGKIKLIFSGLLSVGFLPLFYPKTLLFLLPAFGLSLISGDKNMISYSFHYQDIPLTVLFIAAIFGLKKATADLLNIKNIPEKLRLSALPLSLFVILFHNNQFPNRNIREEWPSSGKSELIREIKAFKSARKNKQHIITIDALLPYFSERPSLQTITRFGFPDLSGGHILVLSPIVNPWPLNESDKIALITEANRLIKTGALVSVYSSKNLLAVRKHKKS